MRYDQGIGSSLLTGIEVSRKAPSIRLDRVD